MATQRQVPVLDWLITRNIRGPSPGRDPFGQPLPGEITTVKLWAARRDFPARDFLDSTTAGLVTIMDSRFIVRDTGAAWATGDTFTNDEGKQRTVQGVSEVYGRGRFLELLARRSWLICPMVSIVITAALSADVYS